MSENYEDLTASGDNTRLGPDYFGFYANEITELLAEEDADLLPSSHDAGEVGTSRNSCRTNENGITSSASSLYSNGIGALLSEFKKERLKSLLRQSVFTLSQEIDEMRDPVHSTCRIKSLLSNCKADLPQHPEKKLKIDEDMQILLDSDRTVVEELMKKHSKGLFATLQHMETKLEELLNTVMTSCRPMTHAEKQQLRKSIQNLPPKSLDRVVEILSHNKPPGTYSKDNVHVDLDELDNVTLWRLHFYVTASTQS